MGMFFCVYSMLFDLDKIPNIDDFVLNVAMQSSKTIVKHINKMLEIVRSIISFR